MDEFVNIAVPRRLYAQVIRFVADHLDADGHGGTTPPPPPSGSPVGQRWDGSRFNALWKTLATPTPRALLEVTSERPGEWVAFREICDKAGVPAAQAAAELAGFTKLLKREFGDRTWPVQVQAPSAAGEGSQYLMSAELAKEWRRAVTRPADPSAEGDE